MILFNTPEFKVGIFIVLISSIIGVMSMKVNNSSGIMSSTKKHSLVLDNASGLTRNSAVKMAGIKVGIIDDIILDGGKARVKILVGKEVPITMSGSVEIRSDGLLGDRHVELLSGNPLDQPLPPGAEIVSITDKGSIKTIINQAGQVTVSLKRLSDILSNAIEGEEGANTVRQILLNMKNITEDLGRITSNNQSKVSEIVNRLHSMALSLDSFVRDESLGGFKASWQRAVDSLQRVDISLRNIEEITEKVNRGKGTIGRLINDEDTVDELNTTMRNVNNLVGGMSKMKTSIDFHSEYLSNFGDAKSFLLVKIQPGLDRYYEVGVVDDPRGLVNSTTTTTTVDKGTPSTSKETKTFHNKVKVNALFAKNFYDFTVKGGIFENSAGIGLDYYLWQRRLRFSLELFGFNDPYMRAYVRYNIFKGAYLIGGSDNLFGEADESSPFIGAGLFITNDDLKTLALKVSL